MTFETLGYCDRLLEHLELSSHRRRRLKDLFVSFKAVNFAGLKDEYVRKYGRHVKQGGFSDDLIF